MSYYDQQTLLGALGVIGLDLETDQSSYAVGQKPLYTITGAIPGSHIAWSSWRDEDPTSEYLKDYGQVVTANGTLEIEDAAWAETDIGRWQKEILVTAPDGATSRAQVFFIVRSAAPATPPGTPTTGSIFDRRIDLPIVGNVSLVGALAVGGIAAYFFTQRR